MGWERDLNSEWRSGLVGLSALALDSSLDDLEILGWDGKCRETGFLF